MKTRARAPSTKAVENKLGLNWDASKKQKYLKGIKEVTLQRLEIPYPTNDFYMASTRKGKDEWDAYWLGKPLRDPRYNHGLRRSILVLDKSQLQYEVKADESVIFRDAETNQIFMIVIRGVIPDDDVREDFVQTCLDVIKVRRDDRREDPGQLCHFGYTCGSRNTPGIQLAANCVKRTPAQTTKLNNQAQGMAGIGWNILRSRIPQLILDDYDDTVKRVGCPRMDMGKTGDETFAYAVGGKSLTFNTSGNLQLPPPSGLCSINYSRFTHREQNGNNWFIALTCRAPDDPELGGNFYNASYGIMMQAATNTVSAWNPSDYHGTTLYEMVEGPERRAGYEVRPDGGQNIGFSFEVSKGLSFATRNAVVKKRRDAGVKKVGRKRRARWTSDTEEDSDEDYVPSKSRKRLRL